MAHLYTFDANSAQFPSTNFPQLLPTNQQNILAFDAATDETCFWQFIAPSGITTPIYADIYYSMASATTNNVVMEVAVEAVTAGDALNVNTTSSFAATNSVTDAVPGSTGYLDSVTVTLTNNDSIEPGDKCRLQFNRDANNASDTATGDMYLWSIVLRDSR
jgi:hypothetical protein